ncbi:hypothetical protein F5Y16DRAFT_366183 [Xylariaceae sp. FL0255]|nr:hypothetical protein F5Y16DRAFT_366183 [Xylariaceae sp. FL0255]
MAAQQDLQELIRLMTVGMKVPLKDALSRVTALQSKNLRSIQQIAESPLPDVQAAVSDAKVARSLRNACKARLKNPTAGIKRAGSNLSASSKRQKTSVDPDVALDGLCEPMKPSEVEESLELEVETDEDIIAHTTLLTNRAPLVLAFAVETLRFTMPEQPPSSRLSLAQAVVSANSRSKAVSIGLEKGLSAEEEGWGHGQPQVTVLGRDVTVLKRGGYEWRQEGEKAKEESNPNAEPPDPSSLTSSATETGLSQPFAAGSTAGDTSRSWSASSPITSKQSTFVVRAIAFNTPAQRQSVLQSLFAAVPSLQTASHNAWAYRATVPSGLFNATTIKEESFDDGESGCGAFLLKNMQETNAVDTLVVMTRWYGGVMLGPDRWRIMRDCLKDALAERMRVTGTQATVGGEAVWGLDLEAMKNKAGPGSSAASSSYIGMPVHRPEAAKEYLLKSFSRLDPPEDKDDTSQPQKTAPKKKMTAAMIKLEKEENVARLLGAIRIVLESWANHMSVSELDRRAWSWYTAVRPEVESGPSGWGVKGALRLLDILAMKRKGS